MKIYKVTIKKTVYVYAESVSEAKATALEDGYEVALTDEVAEMVEESSKKELQEAMFFDYDEVTS